MRQLLPTHSEDVDLWDAYRPAGARDPLLRLNMVMSLDGSVTDAHGRSAGLGGAGDREVFRVLRAQADAILVGAGTARAERYGPHRLSRELARRRESDGRVRPAAIVVVSRSLDLDWSSPLFAEAATPTITLTCAAADPAARQRASRAGRLLVAGDDEVDLLAGLSALRDDLGLPHVLCEGGPRLNGTLLAAGGVDELCLTLAPLLAGGSGPTLASGLLRTHPAALCSAIEHAGELFLRYALTR